METPATFAGVFSADFAIFLCTFRIRRDARAAEWGGLENRCAGNRTEGSNPSLSANIYFLGFFDRFVTGSVTENNPIPAND